MLVDTLQSLPATLAVFAVGITLHLSLFRFGEWDLWTVKFLTVFTTLYVSGVVLLLRQHTEDAISISTATSLVGKLILSLISGIWGSMLIYRGFFHRLCRFPGPFLARFSNFYVTGLGAKKFHLYEEVQQLHRQYGDIVRLGMKQPVML
jgi:hypothetical protein